MGTTTEAAALDRIGAMALRHLERVVAIDSASDEASTTVPTTPGQARLADALAAFFAEQGASVERDAFGNVVASLPGRGEGADKAPIALLVHLDTARGTAAAEHLNVLRKWDGRPVPYPANPRLQVGVEHYPATRDFLGQDLVFGAGDAPFGLDDKLGMTHLMTLACLLAEQPERPHPPLLFIGRPDEEVGREDALHGLVKRLAALGVRHAFTIDGIVPFEINTENFNGARAMLHFPSRPLEAPAGRVRVALGGVNTHGATAHPEGHRAATRLAAEIAHGLAPSCVVGFASDALRDCDAVVDFAVDGEAGRAALEARVAAVVGPHVPRGASYAVGPLTAAVAPADGAAAAALDFVRTFVADASLTPVLAEDSDDRQGYSHPYRLVPEPGGARLDVRVRDFDPEALAARKALIARLAPFGTRVVLEDQYRDMGPRLAAFPELVTWARAAAAQLGIDAPVRPIRGSTGVDPFLDAGIGVANLGTGYFAPESEKELTSLQLMARHALWLCALVQVIARG